MCLKLFPSILFATFPWFFNHRFMAHVQWHNYDTKIIRSRDTVWVFYYPFRTWSKIKKKSFYRCKIQVSVYLSLKLSVQHICQKGDTPSSTAPVFGLGHDMGRFCPFCTRIYTTSASFLGSKKVAKKTKIWCHVLDFM